LGDCDGSCTGNCGEVRSTYRRGKFHCTGCNGKLTDLENKLEKILNENK